MCIAGYYLTCNRVVGGAVLVCGTVRSSLVDGEGVAQQTLYVYMYIYIHIYAYT
jgi:hypothetical protein